MPVEQFSNILHKIFTVHGQGAEIWSAYLTQCSTLVCPSAMSAIPVPASEFCALGFTIIGNAHGLSLLSGLRKCKALFGVTPVVASTLWRALIPTLPPKTKPSHLLWALLRLKTYATDCVCVALVQVDEKTFRKWSWQLILALARLDMVRLTHLRFLSLLCLLILVFVQVAFVIPKLRRLLHKRGRDGL